MLLSLQALRRSILPALLFAGALFGAAANAQPALLLANVYAGHIDPTQYLVSEKYDGVRAVWDGATLRFRSGRTVPAPAWFTARLPAQPLDGELWLARGQFEIEAAKVGGGDWFTAA